MKNYLKALRNLVGHHELILNCAALWVEKKNGVLLERRRDDGNWGLIGGLMELGESPKQTAFRELKEETGVEPAIGELVGVYSKYRHQYPNGDKAQLIVFFFTCEIPLHADIVASDESLEIKYFPRDQLPNFGMEQHRLMAADALAKKRNIIE